MRGNPSKKPLADLQDGVQVVVEIPNCPKHLLPEARREWKRITPLLEELGLIAKVDRAALALYCQAWARWVWCEEHLNLAMETAAEKRAAFEAERAEVELRGETWTKGEWSGGDGFQVPTPNGAFSYSPYWVGANKAADQVDKFLQSFGLSPSSRSRVTPSEIYPWLPGLDPKGEGGSEGENKVRSLSDFAKQR